jgi:hypothetical protein
MQIQTPVVFLGRHLMYFVRHVKSSTERKVIEHTALQFLKFMAYKANYLDHKPSHQSGAACLLTINLFLSPAAVALGIAKSAESVATLQKQLRTDLKNDGSNALSMWSDSIEEMSLIRRDELAELYTMLIKHLDSKQFKNKLAAYPELWL